MAYRRYSPDMKTTVRIDGRVFIVFHDKAGTPLHIYERHLTPRFTYSDVKYWSLNSKHANPSPASMPGRVLAASGEKRAQQG